MEMSFIVNNLVHREKTSKIKVTQTKLVQHVGNRQLQKPAASGLKGAHTALHITHCRCVLHMVSQGLARTCAVEGERSVFVLTLGTLCLPGEALAARVVVTVVERAEFKESSTWGRGRAHAGHTAVEDSCPSEGLTPAGGGPQSEAVVVPQHPYIARAPPGHQCV